MRHGETEQNKESSNRALTAKGVEQCKTAAKIINLLQKMKRLELSLLKPI